MADMIKRGTILIKDGTFLPTGVQFESEPYTRGWRLVKDLDGHGMDRKIRAARWNFFCLAGEIEAAVFGLDDEKMVRRAIERILVRLKSEKFNSLEITRVVSKRFLGMPHVSVFACSRHIQESMFLFRAKDLRDRGPSRSSISSAQSRHLGTASLLAGEVQ
jgi:hypothetical protein